MIESLNQKEPYRATDVHRFDPEGSVCGVCGQLWPCQSILSSARRIASSIVQFSREGEMFRRLREEHYSIHPDHEKEAQPASCPTCRAIVAYAENEVEVPLSMPVISCSECGLPLANEDLLAEHQVTVHHFTDDTEGDAVNSTEVDGPLEDHLKT